MKIRPEADKALGWAFRPDGDTTAALSRGVSKLKKAHFNAGADKPHMGGSGNLADALVRARKAEDKRRIKKGTRRRRMAKRVTASKKRTVASSKKKTVQKAASTGKLIPLKVICAQMDLDPKATRVKLRRLIAKGEIDWHDTNERWEFTPARAKEIRAHLSE